MAGRGRGRRKMAKRGGEASGISDQCKLKIDSPSFLSFLVGWQQLVWRSQRRVLPPPQSPQTDLHQTQSGASAWREWVESLGRKGGGGKRRQVGKVETRGEREVR